ncbi:MAG: DUF3179 domain-containing protein [Ornithinimicrobium sp.]
MTAKIRPNHDETMTMSASSATDMTDPTAVGGGGLVVRLRRSLALVCVGAVVVLAGCGGSDGDGGGGSPSSGDGARTTAPARSSALVDMRNEDFPTPLIDPDEVRSGGPPPDGIPPIDQPTYERAAEVDWLAPQEPVLSLTIDSATRAYPLRVMTWHEIVNDTLGGVPVAVTYCPLCNSGVAFERDLDGEVLTFGTSGRLYRDNLVMYDRQTESLWPQLTGQASIGVKTGTQLTAIPLGTVAWTDFLAAHPDADVLSQDTGFAREYGSNPYTGYDEPDGDLLFDLGDDVDDRLSTKERVVGISGESADIAYLRSALIGVDPVQIDVDGDPVVLWHESGQASALDTREISEGADVGTVGVFTPIVAGQELTFSRVGDSFTDEQTGSSWDVLGRATAGSLAGESLQPVTHLDTFWFAWVLFHPDTDLRGE